MKTLLLALSSTLIGFIFCSVGLANPLAGILEKNDQGVFITLTQTSQKYQVTATTPETISLLKRLENGDYITGSGNFDEDSKTIQIDSLDYVGLKKMLGLWYSGASVMNFSSFSDLSIYPILSKNMVIALSPKTDLRYSMGPYSGNQWALFMSSKDATIFATIEFANGDATLRVFDSETGANTRTMRLVRWSK